MSGVSEAERRYLESLPKDPFAASEAGQAHLAALQAELVERGRPHNLTAAQVEAADKMAMPLDEYAAMGGARTEADYRRVRAQLEASRKVEAEAAHELAVEAAKRAAS